MRRRTIPHHRHDPLPDIEIDLHGKSVIESRSLLEDVLNEPRGTRVRIIVGKGNNSEHGPVLPLFVRSFFREHGVVCIEAHVRNGGKGALEVTV